HSGTLTATAIYPIAPVKELNVVENSYYIEAPNNPQGALGIEITAEELQNPENNKTKTLLNIHHQTANFEFNQQDDNPYPSIIGNGQFQSGRYEKVPNVKNPQLTVENSSIRGSFEI